MKNIYFSPTFFPTNHLGSSLARGLDVPHFKFLITYIWKKPKLRQGWVIPAHIDSLSLSLSLSHTHTHTEHLIWYQFCKFRNCPDWLQEREIWRAVARELKMCVWKLIAPWKICDFWQEHILVQNCRPSWRTMNFKCPSLATPSYYPLHPIFVPDSDMLFPCWNSQSFHLHIGGVSRFTARSLEDETRNGERNANRNPEWWKDCSQLVKIE